MRYSEEGTVVVEVIVAIRVRVVVEVIDEQSPPQ